MDFDEPDVDFELTDSQENAYDEDLGTFCESIFKTHCLGFLDETREKERVIRGRLQPHAYKVMQLGEVMDSQKKLIARANDILSGVPPGQMRILLRKFRWNVESLLETFAEKGEKPIFEGAGLVPPTEAKKMPTTGKGSCLTCMEEMPYSKMFGLACGHFFCKPCWKDYLNLKITEEGQKANLVHCMAFKCNVIVDEGVVRAIVDNDVYNKYLRFLLQSYVDDHPYMTWCPGAGCQLAIEITNGDRHVTVKCNCGTDFCFACKEPFHLPATCPMAGAWKKKMLDDSETYNWLKSNTKDCLSEEMQILTKDGFKFLDEVLAARFDLHVAAYNHATKTFAYEKVSPQDIVLHESATQTMVELTNAAEARRWGPGSDEYGRSAAELTVTCKLNKDEDDTLHSNGLSAVVTPNHDIFVRLGKFYPSRTPSQNGKLGRPSYYWPDSDFQKDKASNLEQLASAPVTGSRPIFKFLTHAVEGSVNTAAPAATSMEMTPMAAEVPPYLVQLGIAPEKELAFLELFGHFLGDGSLATQDSYASFCTVKQADMKFLRASFSTLGLAFLESGPYKSKQVTFRVAGPLYDFLFAEYGRKYKKSCASCEGAGEILPAAHDLISTMDGSFVKPEDIKSAKWFPSWAWRLDKEKARAIIAGLRRADGSEKSNRNEIYTSSARFRDELVRYCLHAGYSARFTIKYSAGTMRGIDLNGRPIVATADNWRVTYNDKSCVGEPVLHGVRGEIKLVQYTGRTWCVTVPTGLIIVRRALAAADGTITKASRPQIIGNCPQCGKATEKNGGCNHISCTCGAHWCWMCNKNFNASTVYSHSCNAFDDKDAFSSDHIVAARGALERYLHYYTRYENHHKSKKLEATLSDKMKIKMERLTTLDKTNPSYIDQVYLKDSLEALFQCRDILKNTYVYAFYMFESELQQKLLTDIPPFKDTAEQKAAKSQFEFHQEGLEMTTEQLSGLLELPIEKILDEKNFRVKTIDLTKNALNKFDAMFKVVGWIKKNSTGSWERVAKAKEDAEKRAKEEEERKAKAKKVKKEKEAAPKKGGRGLFNFGGGAAPAPAAVNPVLPPPAAVPQARRVAPAPIVPQPAAKTDSRSEVDSDEDPELQQALLASMGK